MTKSFYYNLRIRKVGSFLPLLFLVIFSGCADFFDRKTTEIQTENIFRDLSQVKIIPDVNRPYPEGYTPEPTITPAKDGVKIFYFTRHNSPGKLQALIAEQLGNKSSVNSATNQLIVHCADYNDATMVIDFLDQVDVMPIQVKIDCLISEIFADLTMDYETTADITDLFGTDITIESFLPGASLREPARSDIGLKGGVSRKKFNAIIDVLESRGYAKILMNPVLQVVNGTTARIETNERVPIQEQILSGVNIITTIKYEDVVDFLEVTPKVYSDGTIGLRTRAQISSRTIPEGVDQAPIITRRIVENEENRIKKGESLVIAGIRKTERVSVIRGVPFLKDLPIIGIIFSSRDFEDRAKEIIFILTPSISSYGTDHAQMVEQIREKHAKPEYERGITDIITDPFGIGAHTDRLEQHAAQAEFERVRSEIEKVEALNQVDQVKQQLLKTTEGVLEEKAKAARALQQAEKAKAEAEKAKVEAEKAKAETEKAKDETEKAKAETEKIKAQDSGPEQQTPQRSEKIEKTESKVEQAQAKAGL